MSNLSPVVEAFRELFRAVYDMDFASVFPKEEPEREEHPSPDPRPELPEPLDTPNPDLPLFCPRCGGRGTWGTHPCPECRPKK